jgi:hypothetical protein
VTAINCAQLADAAPELALGVLFGRERADALEHLDGCSSCQQLVSSLSGVTDELLRTLAPSVQPSRGFEARVLAALTPPGRTQPQRAKRRGVVAALAVAACVALLAGVFVVGESTRPALAAAKMRSPAGEVVGWIYVDRQEPVGVYLTLPGWADQMHRYSRTGDTYSLQITQRAGENRVVPVSLDSRAAWTATLDVDPDAITGAALIDSQGHVWCHADFGSA